jgi:hypothetical protein
MLREMFALIGGSIAVYASINPDGFIIACIGAVVLAGAFWWLCSVYTRLWNTTFHLKFIHHFLCGLAAVWTIFFVIAFASVQHVDQKVDQEISAWTVQMRRSLESDSVPPSGDAATPARVPTTSTAFFHDFEVSHPFLRDILRAARIAPPEQGTDETASPVDSVENVAAVIADAVRMHLGLVLFRLRVVLLLSFLLAQAIPFGLNGFLAHRDIRPSF